MKSEEKYIDFREALYSSKSNYKLLGKSIDYLEKIENNELTSKELIQFLLETQELIFPLPNNNFGNIISLAITMNYYRAANVIIKYLTEYKFSYNEPYELLDKKLLKTEDNDRNIFENIRDFKKISKLLNNFEKFDYKKASTPKGEKEFLEIIKRNENKSFLLCNGMQGNILAAAILLNKYDIALFIVNHLTKLNIDLTKMIMDPDSYEIWDIFNCIDYSKEYFDNVRADDLNINNSNDKNKAVYNILALSMLEYKVEKEYFCDNKQSRQMHTCSN